MQPIVIMPRDNIQREYIEDENLESLRNHLYVPVVDQSKVSIRDRIHPKGCRCHKCKEESSDSE